MKNQGLLYLFGIAACAFAFGACDMGAPKIDQMQESQQPAQQESPAQPQQQDEEPNEGHSQGY